MIRGYATKEKTRSFTGGLLPEGHGRLGVTGLTASRAGFGGYRVSIGVKTHEKALRRALLSGINLIDTSSNYADGGSESLVGQVLGDLIDQGKLSRSEVIVVSKVGYLQGKNLALGRERTAEGRPFAEVVTYDQGLEHCIHPEFLEDQLCRSLERLNLETIDAYLLHNPEYYLGWAEKNGLPVEQARQKYYHRIRRAFEYLETEVEKGRIRFYGISSNTFPSSADTGDFTHLETVWQTAQAMSPDHHFRVIQLPLNILEPGAVLEANQTDGRSVLHTALSHEMAVLINRPLNAFDGAHLIRLSDIGDTVAREENEIIYRIRDATLSETRLWRKLLSDLDLQPAMVMRIKEQIAVSDVLKHYWRNFGSYERFRQMRDGTFKPRIQGVIEFLRPYGDDNPELVDWMATHTACLDAAFAAVGSTYAEAAAVKLTRIGQAASAADPDWARAKTLSQRAVRVLRSTKGVSTVLVGMRKEKYVTDILQELQRPVSRKDRRGAWESLRQAIV